MILIYETVNTCSVCHRSLAFNCRNQDTPVFPPPACKSTGNFIFYFLFLLIHEMVII